MLTLSEPHNYGLALQLRPAGREAGKTVHWTVFYFRLLTLAAARFACYLANAPIGSQAGSMVAGSSKAFWYSAGSMLFGTATS